MNIVINKKQVAVSSVLIPMAVMLCGCTQVVSLNFDVGGNLDQPVPAMPNLVDPDIKVSVVSKNKGQILVASGRPENGQAINFPNYNGDQLGPRAVLRVVDSDLADGDALSPGKADFTFGADFKLDFNATSVSTVYDNGNNLIQRGLAGDGLQYKIQVDIIDDVPTLTCNLEQKVSAAETRFAFVKSTVVVKTDRWYRVGCSRQGATLNLVVTPYNPDGTAQAAVTTTKTNIPVVDLTWPLNAPVVPMSIGGKLAANDTIPDQSDQFNGLIDNAVLMLY